ncbi:MAG: hypothetical protein NVS1B11_35990 [Terriglobales bacterium]
MRLVRPLRKSKYGSVSYRAIIICVATLSVLLARSAAPLFPHNSFELAASADGDHDHRQSFDHEDPQWAASPSPGLITRAPIASLLADTPEHFVAVMTDGLHYNRPPPVR